jgi:hypothetical protein
VYRAKSDAAAEDDRGLKVEGWVSTKTTKSSVDIDASVSRIIDEKQLATCCPVS